MSVRLRSLTIVVRNNKEKFDREVEEAIENVLEEHDILYDQVEKQFAINDHVLSMNLIWRSTTYED